ncbi:hypothetical protein F4806DRAFT_446388 [Annulohypoxylon nitens]|nr:hypothetical protein F4806DRAFT_446388 [Annulohypoxylon nitens]
MMGANRKRVIGSWPDTGLGGALKESYPAAYDRYKTICDEHNGPDGLPTNILAGCCHVIYPISSDHLNRPFQRVYIACVFSSFGDGHRNWFNKSKPGRSPKEVVRNQTENAFQDMRNVFRKLALNFGRDAPRPEGATPLTEQQKQSLWDETGKNMLLCMDKNNGKDFQMEWKEVDEMFRKCFKGWAGKWVFTEKYYPPEPPYVRSEASLRRQFESSHQFHRMSEAHRSAGSHSASRHASSSGC